MSIPPFEPLPPSAACHGLYAPHDADEDDCAFFTMDRSNVMWMHRPNNPSFPPQLRNLQSKQGSASSSPFCDDVSIIEYSAFSSGSVVGINSDPFSDFSLEKSVPQPPASSLIDFFKPRRSAPIPTPAEQETPNTDTPNGSPARSSGPSKSTGSPGDAGLGEQSHSPETARMQTAAKTVPMQPERLSKASSDTLPSNPLFQSLNAAQVHALAGDAVEEEAPLDSAAGSWNPEVVFESIVTSMTGIETTTGDDVQHVVPAAIENMLQTDVGIGSVNLGRANHISPDLLNNALNVAPPAQTEERESSGALGQVNMQNATLAGRSSLPPTDVRAHEPAVVPSSRMNNLAPTAPSHSKPPLPPRSKPPRPSSSKPPLPSRSKPPLPPRSKPPQPSRSKPPLPSRSKPPLPSRSKPQLPFAKRSTKKPSAAALAARQGLQRMSSAMKSKKDSSEAKTLDLREMSMNHRALSFSPDPAVEYGLSSSGCPYSPEHQAVEIPLEPPLELRLVESVEIGSKRKADALDQLPPAPKKAKKAPKPRKPKRYQQATPSNHCHVCARSNGFVRLAVCTNVKGGSCRKVVCDRCFNDHNWDWSAATAVDSTWTCTHCRNACPARSQCILYSKTNARRKNKTQEEKMT